MRALKALVTVLTLLLIIGFGALIWGVVRQAGKLAEPPAKAVRDDRAPWQSLLLDQPPGTRIANVTSAGDLVLLHLFTGAAGQDERIVVVDPGTGLWLGTIAVTGKP